MIPLLDITQPAPFDPAAVAQNRLEAKASDAPGSRDLSEAFLEMLIAQLRNQDPLEPQDGAEFMGELAQLSNLQELVKIREILEQSDGTPAAGDPPAGPETATATDEPVGAPPRAAA